MFVCGLRSHLLSLAVLMASSAGCWAYESSGTEANQIISLKNQLNASALQAELFPVETKQVASVCFITDAGDCSGDRFGNGETPGGGSGNPSNPDYEDPGQQCRNAGYTVTSCPNGQHPINPCPADSGYYEGCECPDGYDKSCDGAGEQGVGEACNGKYQQCCNACEDYPETSIPSGHVKIGECQSCNGTKYKTQCDPSKYVEAAACGTSGGTGSSCSDDNGTHYTECKCPNGYEWSTSAKDCVCSSSYQYSCTGTGYAGGEGQSCNNKYAKCKCADGYTWNASQGACTCSGIDWCAINQNCSALGYAQQTCTGKAIKCPFDTNYVYCL